MDFQIKDKFFLVCGAGSGFGKAVASKLAQEGAQVLAVSRSENKLIELAKSYPDNISYLSGDLFNIGFHNKIIVAIGNKKLSGALINAGGPPAGGFFDISLSDWDNAWKSVVRWKISLTQKLLPLMRVNNYGRLLYIESVSVKKTVNNLILSNSLRRATVGFVKTLAKEVAGEGITLNVLAPGYHRTAAMERLFVNVAETENITIDEAVSAFEKNIPVGNMAAAEEITPLALYLLSPLSKYVTGEVFSHDGGIRL
jgi:3-oxoacyl-[acyl-carrier protein] reductase